jgi:hypothetical protein
MWCTKKGVKNIINAGIKGQISLATDEKETCYGLNDGGYKVNMSYGKWLSSERLEGLKLQEGTGGPR